MKFLSKISLILLILQATSILSAAQKAIVVGASSGIGEKLAIVLADNGYEVGLVARREEALLALQKNLKTKSYIKRIDVSEVDTARKSFNELVTEMGSVDLIIINAGVGELDMELDWERQKTMIEVNVYGFTAMAQAAIDYFKQQERGHLVGISSVAGVRGMPGGAVYCATKAYVSTLLQGIRATLQVEGRNSIDITDIRPGYVDTNMVKDKEGVYWMISAKEAAQQIYDAIQSKKHVAYISKRWYLVALGMKIVPDWILNWLLSS